jgi:hypothetical protein
MNLLPQQKDRVEGSEEAREEEREGVAEVPVI